MYTCTSKQFRRTGWAMCDVRPKYQDSVGHDVRMYITCSSLDVNQPTFYSFHNQQHGSACRMPSSALKSTSMVVGGRVE